MNPGKVFGFDPQRTFTADLTKAFNIFLLDQFDQDIIDTEVKVRDNVILITSRSFKIGLLIKCEFRMYIILDQEALKPFKNFSLLKDDLHIHKNTSIV